MTLEQDMKIFRRLNPDVSISDEDLKAQLITFRRFSPHANLEKILLGQNKVWNDFLKHYPQADTNHFERINIDGEKFEVDFVGEDGYRKEVWGNYVSDPRTWSESLKRALGSKVAFPDSLLTTNDVYPIPGIPFVDTRERTAFSTDIQIHVSPSESFVAKFRNIFKNTIVTHTSSKEAKRWLSEPQNSYWPQQLNFAVWCATSGCGISLNENYDPLVQGFIEFHVYFTVRRILYELSTPLPDDKSFKQTNNYHDKVALQRLCKEFNLNATRPDFRWKGGKNHGVGTVYYYAGAALPSKSPYPNGYYFFGDEGGDPNKGNLAYFIRNDESVNQYAWFFPKTGKGITKAGMGRVNRSVEAFVYCILGAQVNTRSSISGNSGSAQESQQEMLKLFESAVIEEDISKSIQRFQLSVQEAKLRLDFAIAPGIWLMPSDLILNTGSVVGYNNKLTKATGSMKFGVNDSVNVENRSVGIKHNLGTSKVKLPHSLTKTKFPPTRETPLPVTQTKEKDDVNAPVMRSTKRSKDAKRVAPTTNVHEANLAALTIAAAGVGWWMFR